MNKSRIDSSWITKRKKSNVVCVLQDGQIDYGEFAAMMRKGNGGIGRRTMRSQINLGDAPLGLSLSNNAASDD